MDFNGVQDINVIDLGVFDASSDGLNRTITAQLWNRLTQTVVAQLEFTPNDPGELLGGSRFKALDDALLLTAGFQGSIRSEERRGGKECVSTCRSRWSPVN